MADIEPAALRLLAHPRRLIITDANSARSMAPQEFREKSGHTTIYVLGANFELIKSLVAKFDIYVALAFGSRRELAQFVGQRRNDYDAIEARVNLETGLMVEITGFLRG